MHIYKCTLFFAGNLFTMLSFLAYRLIFPYWFVYERKKCFEKYILVLMNECYELIECYERIVNYFYFSRVLIRVLQHIMNIKNEICFFLIQILKL